ncbi:glycosyltransferase family 1 protein [Mucilaginibacter sp. RS28]|uniref:Glycosyltransferase family 1 protein n=1 Tax=Mucilaginibacter straminoryzae TaxID=2932774 RepID=A0A9X1XBE8_9SPHI|nr:glycosyltransferase family 1 protein [Mucilaginibacter straminoryzae]MCJ8211639.1 glycosyltransferase family 1 protein [Mucilaginibacter straminoryzae]
MSLKLTPEADFQQNNQNEQLPDNLICFSHLRWDFVFQRPQHLLTRLSDTFNIFFIEEPHVEEIEQHYYTFSKREPNIWVMVPHLPPGLDDEQSMQMQKQMFNRFMENKQLSNFIFWYYTPMALKFSEDHDPKVVVYDCMDELSAFKFAPAELPALEKKLMNRADVVFTGGHSLYEAKKHQHPNIYPFPSSIEKKHFLKARTIDTCPADQIDTDKPKMGFYGVIDERFDIDLIGAIADARPDWQLILIGPVVKINPDHLPKNSNIHYLGQKSYQQLPDYMATWDIALIPFQLNESTKFISPTKTPEYLAAGLPVISTPIRDVVHPYGKNNLVHIGETAEEFISAAEQLLNTTAKDKEAWQLKADTFLSSNSWDKTCDNMLSLIKKAADKNSYLRIAQ